LIVESQQYVNVNKQITVKRKLKKDT
jgi:hypothetical protein